MTNDRVASPWCRPPDPATILTYVRIVPTSLAWPAAKTNDIFRRRVVRLHGGQTRTAAGNLEASPFARCRPGTRANKEAALCRPGWRAPGALVSAKRGPVQGVSRRWHFIGRNQQPPPSAPGCRMRKLWMPTYAPRALLADTFVAIQRTVRIFAHAVAQTRLPRLWSESGTRCAEWEYIHRKMRLLPCTCSCTLSASRSFASRLERIRRRCPSHHRCIRLQPV